MNKSIPAFSILRTPENAEEINEVANEWNSKNVRLSYYSGNSEFMSFNGNRFLVTSPSPYPEITLDQFREYFSEKKQYTLPDGDVVSKGDEVWYFDKESFLIYKCYALDAYIASDDDTSECFSTREKCEQALNEYKLKQKQPIAYRFTDTNSEFEVIHNKFIPSIIIPLEIAIRAGFEPIYESPLESFAKKHNLSDEAVTELEQLIKK